ncbi:MAG: hypothetical protein JWR75_479 [Devosia sp.]|nr:hypothetical protein [Devosia sp.]
MRLWPRAFALLGGILLVIGTAPAAACLWLFPEIDQLLPNLLLLAVAPLGIMLLGIAVILFLAGWLRRRFG